MINTVKNNTTNKVEFLQKNDENDISINRVLSKNVLKEINKLKEREIDHIVIQGMPVSKDLPETPKEIREISKQPSLEVSIFKKVAGLLGEISEKGVENTLRFPLIQNGETNIETWHSHFQYQYTMLYCLRDDRRTKTFLESANQIIKETKKEIAKCLLTPFKFLEGVQEFSLIEKGSKNFVFSRYIFDRSDFEEKVKDLDLPDALKKLKKIQKHPPSEESLIAVNFMIERLENPRSYATFKVGDLAIFNEHSTIRFSPSFKPSHTKIGHERWLLAISVKKD